MEPRGEPNYLTAAFLNVYNLSLLTGAVAASALTGDWMIALGAAGLEAVWLALGPSLAPFQRSVRQAERDRAEAADRARVEALMRGLPEREWQRARALDELRREIARDMEHNPSFQAILLQAELDKLEKLHGSFVTLAAACQRADTYLSAVDPRELERQLEAQRRLAQGAEDAHVRELAEKNRAVLEKRLATLQDIKAFLQRARGQLSLIENSVRLLRDQALTMNSPGQLTEQLDDLLVGVEAVQQSVKDEAELWSPVAEVGSHEAASPTSRQGVRGG